MTTQEVTYKTYKEVMDNLTWHGTENYYKFSNLPILLTDGTDWFVKTFKCLWLMKLIGMMALVHKEYSFIVAEVRVDDDWVRVLLQDGNYNKIDAKDIRDVDGLPDGTYDIWIGNVHVQGQDHRVLYLSTEH